jgi:uncharacterized HAD superfamily protein
MQEKNGTGQDRTGQDRSNTLVDFWFEELPKPRLFEWNIYHHNLVRSSAFDLDGVLCVDPIADENDDGAQYMRFLRNAQAKFIPTLPIHTIVTCRLEKYRQQTEMWLQRWNVQYGRLVMLDLPDKRTRKQLNIYAEYKADVYRDENLLLFFESDATQARRIFELTNKPVFSVEENRLLT